MKHFYLLLIAIFFGCKEDFKVENLQISQGSQKELKTDSLASVYYSDHIDMVEFRSLGKVQHEIDRLKAKNSFYSELKNVKTNLSIINNSGETIENLILNVLVRFEFNKTEYFYLKNYRFETDKWENNEPFETQLLVIPGLKFELNRILSIHKPKKVSISSYFTASNSVGYNNLEKDIKVFSDYVDMYGEVYTNYSDEQIKSLGEKLFEKDITKLWLNSEVNPQDCENTTTVNEKEICLPEIEGFLEILNNDIEAFSDMVEKVDDVTLPNNKMVGFYIDSNFPYDIYSSVFVNSLQKNDVNLVEFQDIAKTQESYFPHKISLDDLPVIEQNNEVGRQFLIESYSFDERVRTYILYNNYSESYITALNFNHIQGKVILSSLFMPYNNAGSVADLKLRNEFFTKTLLESNPQ